VPTDDASVSSITESGSAAARVAARVPAYVLRVPTGPYRSLNPLTRFVIAIASAAVAFGRTGLEQARWRYSS